MKPQEGLRNLRLSAIAACVMLTLFAGVYSWQSWRDVNARDQQQMAALVEVSAMSLDIYFRNLEGALMSAGETALDGRGRFDPALAETALQRLLRAHPRLRAAVITRADGHILASTEPRLPGAVPTIAARPRFGAMLEEIRSHPLSIGRAFLSPISGDWLIPVFYGVRAGGELRYLVGTVLTVSATQVLWQNAVLGPEAALGVIRDDGYLVGRYPIPGKVELTDVYGKPRIGGGADVVRQQNKSGSFRAMSSITQQEVVIVYRRLVRVPLTVFASNPLANRRSEWLDSVWMLWLFAAAAVAGLAAIYAWSRRRQLAWDAERERSFGALERANQELEAFNYTVSHDLRAPLRAVSSFGALLLERHGERLEAEGRGFLQRILAGARRMSLQVEHLLNLARISRQACVREPVDLSAVAREIVDELRAAQPERSVEVVIAPDMVVHGDPTLLHVALQNLIENAWKFTGRTEGARIEVGAEPRGGQAVFYVLDNGSGFDMQYADKLFRAFERLHGEEEFPGTGIGLAVVERIMQRHGGRPWAVSSPGKGACFYFTLGETAPT